MPSVGNFPNRIKENHKMARRLLTDSHLFFLSFFFSHQHPHKPIFHFILLLHLLQFLPRTIEMTRVERNNPLIKTHHPMTADLERRSWASDRMETAPHGNRTAWKPHRMPSHQQTTQTTWLTNPIPPVDIQKYTLKKTKYSLKINSIYDQIQFPRPLPLLNLAT